MGYVRCRTHVVVFGKNTSTISQRATIVSTKGGRGTYIQLPPRRWASTFQGGEISLHIWGERGRRGWISLRGKKPHRGKGGVSDYISAEACRLRVGEESEQREPVPGSTNASCISKRGKEEKFSPLVTRRKTPPRRHLQGGRV